MLAILIGAAGSIGAAAPVVANTVTSCHLTLNDGLVSIDLGAIYRQDFYVDAEHCLFLAGPTRQLEGQELAAYLLSQSEIGVGQALQPIARGASPTSSGTLAVLSGPLVVYNRHSTWDCCGLETTYTDHQQTFTWDGTNSTVSQALTTPWARTATGWFINGGPTAWYNTANPATSVSSEGWASFDNTTFPCGCQPCNHALYSEVRSYADGTWSRSSSYASNGYPQICSGWIHTSSTWGTR